VSEAKGIHMLFSAGDSGIVWADTGLDITNDVIKQFDAGTAAPAKPPVQQ
jgi:Skp family chaperone for outer membrane proteins